MQMKEIYVLEISLPLIIKYYIILSHILKHEIEFLVFNIYFLFHSICSVKMWNADFLLYIWSLRVQFGKKNFINKSNLIKIVS